MGERIGSVFTFKAENTLLVKQFPHSGNIGIAAKDDHIDFHEPVADSPIDMIFSKSFIFLLRNDNLLIKALIASLIIHGLLLTLQRSSVRSIASSLPTPLQAELRTPARAETTGTSALQKTKPTPVVPSLLVRSKQAGVTPDTTKATLSAPQHSQIGSQESGAKAIASRNDLATSVVHPPQYHASYLDNPRPAYPLAARRQGLEGTVSIDVLVSRGGLPRELRLKASSGAMNLDEAALAAVHRWRFVPARRGEENVEGWVTVPIRFQLESST